LDQGADLVAAGDALGAGRGQDVQHRFLAFDQQVVELVGLVRGEVEALEEIGVGELDAALLFLGPELVELRIVQQRRDVGEAAAPVEASAGTPGIGGIARGIRGAAFVGAAAPPRPPVGQLGLEVLVALFQVPEPFLQVGPGGVVQGRGAQLDDL